MTQDHLYRIYKNRDSWFFRYEITRGSKAPGQIYTSHGVACTFRGAKRLVACLVRADRRGLPGPVWTQTPDPREEST